MRILLLLSLLVGACADRGEFPSLARRAVEDRPVPRIDDEVAVAPVGPAAADVRSAVARLRAEAAAGDERFAPALSTARAAARRAGPVGGDSWAEAQQQLTRAEAARVRTATALADLHALGAAEAARGRPSAGADLRLITDAIAAVSGLSDRQLAALEALRTQLGG